MSARSRRIAELNDEFRTKLCFNTDIQVTSRADIPDKLLAEVVMKVVHFDDFGPDNDPSGEHDFGALDTDGVGRVFWRIDYYDPEIAGESSDPGDAQVTKRVLSLLIQN